MKKLPLIIRKKDSLRDVLYEVLVPLGASAGYFAVATTTQGAFFYFSMLCGFFTVIVSMIIRFKNFRERSP